MLSAATNLVPSADVAPQNHWVTDGAAVFVQVRPELVEVYIAVGKFAAAINFVPSDDDVTNCH
jgi:hypothetical protein